MDEPDTKQRYQAVQNGQPLSAWVGDRKLRDSKDDRRRAFDPNEPVALTQLAAETMLCRATHHPFLMMPEDGLSQVDEPPNPHFCAP